MVIQAGPGAADQVHRTRGAGRSTCSRSMRSSSPRRCLRNERPLHAPGLAPLARRGYGTTPPTRWSARSSSKGAKSSGAAGITTRASLNAEMKALRDARRDTRWKAAPLYVTLEPCCTAGTRRPAPRTPLWRRALNASSARAVDPNPQALRGKDTRVLRRAGVAVKHGLMAEQCERLNEAFNHWIVRRTPFVTVKAGMTLDGKIATSPRASRGGLPARRRAPMG